jgi:hypothetical protein
LWRVIWKQVRGLGKDDFHPGKKLGKNDDSFIRLEFADSCFVEGPVIDGLIHVQHIDFCGVFSGTSMREVFESALEESTGILVASCIYEAVG